MEIAILKIRQDNVIAWEVQFGKREGSFQVAQDGTIVYRHPDDDKEWFAGESEEHFRTAATAWNRYTRTVAGISEQEQMVAVERLSNELATDGAISGRPNCLWTILLEQARDGLL